MDKPLISEEYRKLNAELHDRKAKYGGKGDAWGERVVGYIKEVRAQTMLDYGCGKGNLISDVHMRQPSLAIRGYDPVTAPELPTPADFVTCNDVLEHIEPALLDNVLEHIASLIRMRGLLVISQRLANKTLADGRNAHLIVEKTGWWIKRLKPYFSEIIEVDPIKPKRKGVELAVLVKPRKEGDESFTHGKKLTF